ncbi:Nucleoside-diphosphate-sugar epimerase [Melghirimyces thermohalophilus]|uniref:Nucleoside-diphosphate-sugar epimerase n=1 Tax=Melghirimyces thermohalophilus TaxID=1236220 RepID=A0A1G6KUN5_9BACL|nr:NAD-dependent epimerase/dehydratase family protein [Melghirimyces thermohalophilus]SDC34205.1 Nucleoside-diphosphate-sugar epimerase [Melghirimyces thermohalophilus]
MILVTGADGYIGWPLMLKLSRTFPEERVVGVDHFGRRRWVEEIGSVSAIPIASMDRRLKTARSFGMRNLSFIEADLTNYQRVLQLLKTFQPRVILHMAAQPAAPYSHLHAPLAHYTQENNNQMCRNLVWGIKECGLERETHLVETTTTGVYGAPNFTIPEGFIEVETATGSDTIPYPGMATSWYHMSKVGDINNLYLSSKMWGLTITDLRTAIVFGTGTEETRLHPDLTTRFDFDFYFGVVANRFCAQMLAGHPITLYGKGAQKKPMIALEDAVDSLAKAASYSPPQTFQVFNQMTLLASPKQLAEEVQQAGREQGLKTEVTHIANPRKENETHQMKMENKGFQHHFLADQPVSLREGISRMVKDLMPYRSVFHEYKDRFL